MLFLSIIYMICFLRLLGVEARNTDQVCEEVKDDTGMDVRSCKNSSVFSSLPLAIKWLRDTAQKDRFVRFQVMLVFWDYICLRFYGLLLQILPATCITRLENLKFSSWL